MCLPRCSGLRRSVPSPIFFLFKDPPPTVIYTLSLHDALPIYEPVGVRQRGHLHERGGRPLLAEEFLAHGDEIRAVADVRQEFFGDRKSTRLNSSHVSISYAVFCLKKKTKDIAAQHAGVDNPDI